MATAAELIAQLNDLPADAHADALTLLANDGGAVVKAARSKAFASGKKEGEKAGTATAAELTSARERVTELETEVTELKANKPDAAAIEETARKKWEPKLHAATQRAETAETALRQKDVSLTFADFLTELSKPAEDGTRVDPEWLQDVALSRWGGRLKPKDGGGVQVLQLEGETEYEAPDAKAAVRLLAADARKTVPARYLLSNADSGAGITGAGFGTGGGAYDAAKVGREQGRQQRETNTAKGNDLALR